MNNVSLRPKQAPEIQSNLDREVTWTTWMDHRMAWLGKPRPAAQVSFSPMEGAAVQHALQVVVQHNPRPIVVQCRGTGEDVALRMEPPRPALREWAMRIRWGVGKRRVRRRVFLGSRLFTLLLGSGLE